MNRAWAVWDGGVEANFGGRSVRRIGGLSMEMGYPIHGIGKQFALPVGIALKGFWQNGS
jgi:hypothetical protein